MTAVSKNRPSSSVTSALAGMSWPLFWGLAACAGFYALIHFGVIQSELVSRYFAGHPVEYIEAGMFFVGLAALLLKALDVSGQYVTLGRLSIEPEEEEPFPPETSTRLLEALAGLPRAVRRSYLGRRLHDALDFIHRRGSADGLDDELKYLAEGEAARQHESYSIVRIITWATPMLGFLGTVIGITMALGDLSPELLVNSPKDAMEGLLAGLSVAFDTTALAITLSVLLMIVMFFVDRVETQLLSAVERRAAEELAGRFATIGGATDPSVAVVERMAREVVDGTERLVVRQAELWQQTIDAAHHEWQAASRATAEESQQILREGLKAAMQDHAAALAGHEKETAAAFARRWEQWQVALSENARLMYDQQKELARQSEALERVVQATGDVVSLERALNENLEMLAGSKNFEDTVMSLSAAIHLLNTRLTPAGGVREPAGRGAESQERAA